MRLTLRSLACSYETTDWIMVPRPRNGGNRRTKDVMVSIGLLVQMVRLMPQLYLDEYSEWLKRAAVGQMSASVINK